MAHATRHKTTTRTAGLVRRLVELAQDIDAGQLASVSAEARAEWAKTCGKWPTTAEIRSGSIRLSDEELELMVKKVLRFKAILTRQRRPHLMLVAAAPAAVRPADVPAPRRRSVRGIGSVP